MKKIIICDDEPLARQRLKFLLSELSDCEVQAEISDGIDLKATVEEHDPDVVLLDISMPQMTGIEAAQQVADLENPPAIIFCTAFDDYAIEAFKVHAVSYLMKPIKREDLQRALKQTGLVNKAQLTAIEERQKLDQNQEFIVARTHRGLERIAINQVYYFNADQKYVLVVHKEGEVLIDEPLKELEEKYNEEFVRIHRSTLVRMDKIRGLRALGEGKFGVELQGVEDILPVSRRHLSQVRQLIKS